MLRCKRQYRRSTRAPDRLRRYSRQGAADPPSHGDRTTAEASHAPAPGRRRCGRSAIRAGHGPGQPERTVQTRTHQRRSWPGRSPSPSKTSWSNLRPGGHGASVVTARTHSRSPCPSRTSHRPAAASGGKSRRPAISSELAGGTSLSRADKPPAAEDRCWLLVGSRHRIARSNDQNLWMVLGGVT
jgi:hypothetical protein